jgi:hypothetical protein
MSNKLECPKLFEFWTADEVAECLDGIGEVSAALWNKVVPQQEADMKKDPNIKEVGYMEYPDQKWGFSLKRYWKMLNDDEKKILIEAVKKHEKEYA